MTEKADKEDPFARMQQWLEKESALASGNSHRIILATASPEGIPHSRVVAIREITPQGLIFFTQQGTKKVTELLHNPHASMTLWLAQQQRQVVLNGEALPLSLKENQSYWEKLPRERQVSFFTYAPLSGKPIDSTTVLDQRFKEMEKQFANQPIPMSEHYFGFRFIAKTFCFYTLGTEKFSEVLLYSQQQGHWQVEQLSP